MTILHRTNVSGICTNLSPAKKVLKIWRWSQMAFFMRILAACARREKKINAQKVHKLHPQLCTVCDPIQFDSMDFVHLGVWDFSLCVLCLGVHDFYRKLNRKEENLWDIPFEVSTQFRSSRE